LAAKNIAPIVLLDNWLLRTSFSALFSKPMVRRIFINLFIMSAIIWHFRNALIFSDVSKSAFTAVMFSVLLNPIVAAAWSNLFSHSRRSSKTFFRYYNFFTIEWQVKLIFAAQFKQRNTWPLCLKLRQPMRSVDTIGVPVPWATCGNTFRSRRWIRNANSGVELPNNQLWFLVPQSCGTRDT